MERKFALFDIDKTLIRGDSLFALYFYGAKKWPVYWLWLPVIPFAGLLYALRILPVERVKRISYAPLRRFSEGDFADFFDRYILARSLPQPMERLRRRPPGGFLYSARDRVGRLLHAPVCGARVCRRAARNRDGAGRARLYRPGARPQLPRRGKSAAHTRVSGAERTADRL